MQSIDISTISSKLSQLRHQQDQASALKACLFNLVVYSQDKCRSTYLQEFIKSVVKYFSCRIIFVEGDHSTDPDHLGATVSAETAGKKDLATACERITIEAGKSYLSRVPFIVLPLLIPDLPVFLLWGLNPTIDNKVLPPLKKIATRFIFDSETVEDLPRFCATLTDKNSEDAQEMIDMNWARLSGWRKVMPQVFDSSEKISQLTSTKTLRITYNAKVNDCFQRNEWQALYFQGWLATQLGWKPQGIKRNHQGLQISYSNDANEQVTVAVVGKEHASSSPGVLLNVDINTYDKTHLTLTNNEKAQQVLIEASTPHHCQVPYSLALLDTEHGPYFIREVFYEPVSHHYVKMLQVLKQLNIPIKNP